MLTIVQFFAIEVFLIILFSSSFTIDVQKALQKKKEAAATAAPATGKAKEMNPPPQFLADRLAMFDRLKAEREAWLAAQTPEDIKITLPDGKQVDAQTLRTTPYDVACGISKG